MNIKEAYNNGKTDIYKDSINAVRNRGLELNPTKD